MNGWESYESGPFCRHWHDPYDCERTCARCGHRCGRHVDPYSCNESTCECDAWVEDEAPEYQLHEHTWQPIAGGLVACVCGAVKSPEFG